MNAKLRKVNISIAQFRNFGFKKKTGYFLFQHVGWILNLSLFLDWHWQMAIKSRINTQQIKKSKLQHKFIHKFKKFAPPLLNMVD